MSTASSFADILEKHAQANAKGGLVCLCTNCLNNFLQKGEAAEEAEHMRAGTLPADCTLSAFAKFFHSRVPAHLKTKLDSLVAKAKASGKPLRIATACSGCDGPVKGLLAQCAAMGVPAEHLPLGLRLAISWTVIYCVINELIDRVVAWRITWWVNVLRSTINLPGPQEYVRRIPSTDSGVNEACVFA
jgi:hypothetical protein